MKNKLFGLMLSAALFAIVACDNKDNDMTPPQTATPAVIKGTLFTFGEEEASTALELGKDLGMYMFKEGTADLVAPYENIKYQTASRPLGFLAPEVSDNVLYYPEDGSKVDIIAYYPYKNNMVNNTYPVNVANQKSSTNFNLYYAKNGKGLSKSNTKISLELRPVLTKLIFNLKAGDGVKDENLKDATSYISGMNTTADFNLLTATFGNLAGVKNIDLLPVDKQNSVTGQVLPSPTVNGYTMHLALPNMANATRQVNFTNFVNNDTFLTKLESNYRYTFNVIVSLEKVEVKLVEAKPVEDWTDGGSNISGSGTVELVRTPIVGFPIGDLNPNFRKTPDLCGYVANTGKGNNASLSIEPELNSRILHYKTIEGKVCNWYDLIAGFRFGKPEPTIYELKVRMKKAATSDANVVAIYVKGTGGDRAFPISSAKTPEAYAANQTITLTNEYTEYTFKVDFAKTTKSPSSYTELQNAIDSNYESSDLYIGLFQKAANVNLEYYMSDISLTKK